MVFTESISFHLFRLSRYGGGVKYRSVGNGSFIQKKATGFHARREHAGGVYKKATGRTSFTCEDGDLFLHMIEEATATGEPTTVKAKSVGKNKDGETVATFFITWSFKAKHTGTS